MKHKLTQAKVIKRPKGWFIVGFECGDMGPYTDKETAHDDAVGVQQFYQHYKEKGFITSDES